MKLASRSVTQPNLPQLPISRHRSFPGGIKQDLNLSFYTLLPSGIGQEGLRVGFQIVDVRDGLMVRHAPVLADRLLTERYWDTCLEVV